MKIQKNRIKELEEFARYAAKYPLAADIRERAESVMKKQSDTNVVPIAKEMHAN